LDILLLNFILKSSVIPMSLISASRELARKIYLHKICCGFYFL